MAKPPKKPANNVPEPVLLDEPERPVVVTQECSNEDLHGMIAELKKENERLSADNVLLRAATGELGTVLGIVAPLEVSKVLRRLMPLHMKHHDQEAIGMIKDVLARLAKQ